jgi:hypothetical protein
MLSVNFYYFYSPASQAVSVESFSHIFVHLSGFLQFAKQSAMHSGVHSPAFSQPNLAQFFVLQLLTQPALSQSFLSQSFLSQFFLSQFAMSQLLVAVESVASIETSPALSSTSPPHETIAVAQINVSIKKRFFIRMFSLDF